MGKNTLSIKFWQNSVEALDLVKKCLMQEACISSPKFSRYPRMHLGRANGGKHVGARLAQGNGCSSILKLKKGKKLHYISVLGLNFVVKAVLVAGNENFIKKSKAKHVS